jgi:hypothetical protein
MKHHATAGAANTTKTGTMLRVDYLQMGRTWSFMVDTLLKGLDWIGIICVNFLFEQIFELRDKNESNNELRQAITSFLYPPLLSPLLLPD